MVSITFSQILQNSISAVATPRTSAPDRTRKDYDASIDPLVGWGGVYPSDSLPYRRLRRLTLV